MKTLEEITIENENLKQGNIKVWEQLKEYEQIVTSYNMKPIDYDIACETVNKLLDEKKVLKEENTKLKELLKECRKSFNKLKGDTVWYPYEVDECIAKIDEVLK